MTGKVSVFVSDGTVNFMTLGEFSVLHKVTLTPLPSFEIEVKSSVLSSIPMCTTHIYRIQYRM